MIYLDNAATTPILEEVYSEMLPYLTAKFGNPSSIYSIGRETKIAIEKTRQLISTELNCHPSEIIFTSGGTESINKILLSAVEDLKCSRIISSPIEHHATLHTLDYLQKNYNLKIDFVHINPNGNIDYNHLEELLKSVANKTFVFLLHANNEIGNLTDMHTVANLCQTHNALLGLDTVQTVTHYKIDLKKIKISFITCSAHKFHGPKGVGFVYINAENKITPILHGGGQERNMRAGTENVHGIIGLGKAFEIQYKNLEDNKSHILNLKQYLYNALLKNFNGVTLFGNPDFSNCLYTVLNIGFPKNKYTDMLVLNLDIANILVSSGSACSSGADKASHVIKTLLKNKADTFQSIRFSFSHLNTQQELDTVIDKLNQIINT